MFKFDKPGSDNKIIDSAIGLSYYSIQKTLVTAIKRSLLDQTDRFKPFKATISTEIWQELITQEKVSLQKK